MSEYERTTAYLNDLTDQKKKLTDSLSKPDDMTYSDIIPEILDMLLFYNTKTQNGTSFHHYYHGRSELTESSNLDTSAATSMSDMFSGCTSLTEVPLFDTSKVTSMNSMFSGCTSLTEVPLFDTSKVTSMNSMFSGCTSLTEVPLFDTSNVTNINNMFDGAGVIEHPLFDFGNVTSAVNAFGGNRSLKTIPAFNFSNLKSAYRVFQYAYELETVPPLNLGNASNFQQTFSNCQKLSGLDLVVNNMGNCSYMCEKCWSMKYINISGSARCDNAFRMFLECVNLSVVPGFDLRNCTNTGSMLSACRSMEECLVKNIKVDLQVGSGTSWGHLLTLESLLHLIKECRNVNAARTLTVGSANLEKLANVYVRLVDITDEMRAEDDLIDEKLPFEVCESSDEGAMLIINYATLKQWTIK